MNRLTNTQIFIVALTMANLWTFTYSHNKAKSIISTNAQNYEKAHYARGVLVTGAVCGLIDAAKGGE